MLQEKSFSEEKGIQGDFGSATLSKIHASVANEINEWLNIKTGKKPILLLRGPPGSGKTYAMAAILNDEWCKYAKVRGISIRFYKESEFHSALLKGFGQPDFSMDGERRKICRETNYLMIDDLSTTKMTDTKAENIYTLLDERYNNRNCVTTIISTNLGLDEIEKSLSVFNPTRAWAIRDRFKGATDIVFPNLDYRNRCTTTETKRKYELDEHGNEIIKRYNF